MWSAATWAAYGVDFLDPLNPFAPEEDQAITLPLSSAIEIIVLLKVEYTYAIPEIIFLFTFFFFLNVEALSDPFSVFVFSAFASLVGFFSSIFLFIN